MLINHVDQLRARHHQDAGTSFAVERLALLCRTRSRGRAGGAPARSESAARCARRNHHADRRTTISASKLWPSSVIRETRWLQQVPGVGIADRAHLCADGRRARAVRAQPRCGSVSGPGAAPPAERGPGSAAAHQQVRRSLSAASAGAVRARDHGTIRRRLLVAALGARTRAEAAARRRSARWSPWRENWRCCCIGCGADRKCSRPFPAAIAA